MEKTLQDIFRKEFNEKYQKLAFEAMALYQYWGQKLEALQKQMDEYGKRIRKAQDEINLIQASPEHHTVENKQKVKALKADIASFEKVIQNIDRPKKGDESVLQKLGNECVSLQRQAGEYLEQAEQFKTFSLRTPEEIEEHKKKSAEHKCSDEKCENMISGDKTHCIHHEVKA